MLFIVLFETAHGMEKLDKVLKKSFVNFYLCGITLKTILRHRNCFLSSVAADGKDGNGLKLEKIGPIFSSFYAMSSRISKKYYG